MEEFSRMDTDCTQPLRFTEKICSIMEMYYGKILCYELTLGKCNKVQSHSYFTEVN